MTHNGWRKPTPGLVAAEKFAQAGERLSVSKSQAIVAAKKVAAAIGLKAQDLLLLDTFGAITQPQDWEQGRRPIVWASNNFLMEQTGFSLTTLRFHVRRLCEVGVICMKDSPNGKRYGSRNEQGYIVEAYGFDLAPLAARAAEFEALHAQLQEERQFCKSLRNAITVTRRIVRAKIEKALESGLNGPWRDLQAEFVSLLQRLPTRSAGAEALLNVFEWFKTFQSRVEETFAAAFNWPEQSDAVATNAIAPDTQTEASQNSAGQGAKANEEGGSSPIQYSPKGAENGTHILTTKQPHLVNSNSFETKHAAQTVPEKQRAERAEPLSDVELDGDWSNYITNRSSEIDISTLMATCPQFGEVARGLEGYIRDWAGVHSAASKIRPMVGISDHAWNVAQKALGSEVAAAAVALIYDKHASGEVSSPGGYLRGMVQKAQAGDLHLDRSFYGRMQAGRG